MLVRCWKLCRCLSCGAITLGFLQAFGMLPWSELLTGFLATLLSVLVTLLLGGDVSTLTV